MISNYELCDFIKLEVFENCLTTPGYLHKCAASDTIIK